MDDLEIAVVPFWPMGLLLMGAGLWVLLFSARSGRPRFSNWIGWAFLAAGGLVLALWAYIWLAP